MNTRQKMTARYLELWATMAVSPEESDAVLEAMLRHEFPSEPPSVHDAAITAAIGQKARELAVQLRAILKANEAAQ
jgi:hypothetical protein